MSKSKPERSSRVPPHPRLLPRSACRPLPTRSEGRLASEGGQADPLPQGERESGARPIAKRVQSSADASRIASPLEGEAVPTSKRVGTGEGLFNHIAPAASGLQATVIGDGGWGTALALLLHENGNAVTVWGPFPDYIQTVVRQRENSVYLPGVELPPELRWTADRETAVDGADVVVLASPTKFFRPVIESFADWLPASCTLVSVAKGLDPQTHQRMTQVAEDVLGRGPVAALSGPSLAPEVARGVPTAVVVASRDEEQARRLQAIFASRRFRVYTSDDVVGVELGGALKNIIALAAGISDGLGFGDNTRAALITRGLAETTRLGIALGARPATFAGLSGAGDLVLTCTSRTSRNHMVGERLGRGEAMDRILADMKQVAEGVWNCRVALALARKLGIEVPITEQVCAVVHEGRNPKEALASLMAREVKPEAG